MFTAFASKEKQKPVIAPSRLPGGASRSSDWRMSVTIWRGGATSMRSMRAEVACRRSAPALARYLPNHPRFEKIVRSINVTVVTAGIAERNVSSVASSKLMMSRTDIEVLLADPRELQKLGAAVRTTVTELDASRLELKRLKELFAGEGVLPAAVRDEVLERIGQDGVGADQVTESWTRLRRQIVLLQDRREDFNCVDAIGQAFAEAGAPIFARRVRTEVAQSATSDMLTLIGRGVELRHLRGNEGSGQGGTCAARRSTRNQTICVSLRPWCGADGFCRGPELERHGPTGVDHLHDCSSKDGVRGRRARGASSSTHGARGARRLLRGHSLLYHAELACRRAASRQAGRIRSRHHRRGIGGGCL